MEPKQYLTVFLVFFSVITCMSIEAVELIRNKGSGTLSNIARVWAENYQQHTPGVEIIVIGSTSGAGIAEFINASIEIINSSQPLSDKEIELATRRGKNPREHLVAYDALALFVHNNNPLPSLSISDLAQIFAEGGRTKYWTDFDVEVPNCNEQRIVIVGRHNTSGAHNYFRRSILGKECYKWGIRTMFSAEEVVNEVGKNPCAIGYSSHTYAREGVKLVCVSGRQGKECVKPNVNTIADHSYPLVRPLYMYTDGKPKAEIQAYLDWILGDEGQCITLKEGFVPIRSVTCP